jgi:hypothetical protein
VTESINKKKLDDIKAWDIIIAKPATQNKLCPETTARVNQCISITVEYAISFFKSTW